jgi:hypothetical protein
MIYSEDNLIDGCVEKLKTLGFINATKENILRDEVYKYHLKIFMNSLKGHTDNLDIAIKELISKMEKNK